jgi:signal peptidase II
MTLKNPSPTEPQAAPLTPRVAVVTRWGATRWGLVAYAAAICTLILDQLSKFWVLHILNLPDKGTVPILPFFSLTMVWNPGVSFGLLRAQGEIGRLLLAAFAGAVVIGLGVWARRLERPLTAIGVGMVMGGAVGNNLIDRLRFGRVVDFLDVTGVGFFPWVFNVADSAITIGVILLILDSFAPSRKAPGQSRA